MAKRFDQYCPVAHALSLIGERWALLIVRELLRGPKRFTDVERGLPGIPTNILSSRLRDLEAAGVLEKRKLPPPAASTVYELTEYGQGLEEAVYALARWGARSLGPPKPDDELYEDWGLNAFRAIFNPGAAEGLNETYEIHVDDDVFTAKIVDGTLEPSCGAAASPHLVVWTDKETFFFLCARELEPREAAKKKLLRYEGDPKTLERCFTVLSFAERSRTAA